MTNIERSCQNILLLVSRSSVTFYPRGILGSNSNTILRGQTKKVSWHWHKLTRRCRAGHLLVVVIFPFPRPFLSGCLLSFSCMKLELHYVFTHLWLQLHWSLYLHNASMTKKGGVHRKKLWQSGFHFYYYGNQRSFIPGNLPGLGKHKASHCSFMHNFVVCTVTPSFFIDRR